MHHTMKPQKAKTCGCRILYSVDKNLKKVQEILYFFNIFPENDAGFLLRLSG